MMEPLCRHCWKTKSEHYHDQMRNTFQCMFGEVIGVICTYDPRIDNRGLEEELMRFAKKLQEAQKPIPPDIQKIINKRLFDIL